MRALFSGPSETAAGLYGTLALDPRGKEADPMAFVAFAALLFLVWLAPSDLGARWVDAA